jgi:hypothetical protein
MFIDIVLPIFKQDFALIYSGPPLAQLLGWLLLWLIVKLYQMVQEKQFLVKSHQRARAILCLGVGAFKPWFLPTPRYPFHQIILLPPPPLCIISQRIWPCEYDVRFPETMNHQGRLAASHKSPARRPTRSHDRRGVPEASDEDFPVDFYGAGSHTTALAAALSGDPAFYGVNDRSNSIKPVADDGEGVLQASHTDEGVVAAWAANVVAVGVAPAAVFWVASSAGPRTVNTVPGASHGAALAAAQARGTTPCCLRATLSCRQPSGEGGKALRWL